MRGCRGTERGVEWMSRTGQLESKLTDVVRGDLDRCLSCDPLWDGVNSMNRGWVTAAAVSYALREAGLDPEAVSSFVATKYHKPGFKIGGTREFAEYYGFHLPCCSARKVLEAAKAFLGED